jgi:hypothetical protein
MPIDHDPSEKFSDFKISKSDLDKVLPHHATILTSTQEVDDEHF